MSGRLVTPTVVRHLFLQFSRLERASRSLAKTGLFFHFFVVFFCVGFLGVFWEALGGPLGAVGSIWEPFGEPLGVIFVFFPG